MADTGPRLTHWWLGISLAQHRSVSTLFHVMLYFSPHVLAFQDMNKKKSIFHDSMDVEYFSLKVYLLLRRRE